MWPDFLSRLVLMKTFTVNVPSRFPDVGSDAAQRMAALALREGIVLAPDRVGSGPKVLRLTVEESTADGLCDLAGGASMAEAWRRLFSTVAGRPALSAPRESSRVLPAELPEYSPSDSGPPSGWLPKDDSEYRQAAWERLSPDRKAELCASFAPACLPKPVARDAKKPLSFGAFMLAWIIPAAIAVGLYLLVARFGTRAGGVSSARNFPAWRPQ
jgi:hypothetical protein